MSDFGIPREALGQAEVRHARLIVRVDQHIRGLQVAVQNPPLMGEVDRLGNRPQVLRRPSGRQRSVPGQVRQRRSRHIVHHQVMLALGEAHLMHRHDVRDAAGCRR